MPLYEYRCVKCNRHTEKIERLQGPFLKKCPHCGGDVERMPSAPAIQFKGSGWYVTDYARKTSGGDSSKSEKSDGGESNSAKAEKAEKSDSKTQKPAKETKEAKKTASKDK